MRMIFYIIIGLMTIASCSHKTLDTTTNNPLSDDMPNSHKGLSLKIKGLDADSLPFIYVNGDWYPWFGAKNLDDFPYDSIKDLIVRNDDYGNRAIFVEYPKSIVDSIKNAPAECFINTDPSVTFNNGNGSVSDMLEWIRENKKFPKGFTGKKAVVVSFEIYPDGNVANVSLFKGCDNEEINQDAVRLVKDFPRFEVIYYTPWRKPIRQAIRLTYDKNDSNK